MHTFIKETIKGPFITVLHVNGQKFSKFALGQMLVLSWFTITICVRVSKQLNPLTHSKASVSVNGSINPSKAASQTAI